MSLARARSRGARLNARFGVNGSQNESRSLGWRAAAALTLLVIKFIAASAEAMRDMRSLPLCQKPAKPSQLFLPRDRGGKMVGGRRTRRFHCSPHPCKSRIAASAEVNRVRAIVL